MSRTRKKPPLNKRRKYMCHCSWCQLGRTRKVRSFQEDANLQMKELDGKAKPF